MLRFPAAGGAGIVVIEIGPRPTHAALLDRVRELLIVLGYEVAGRRVVDRQARPCTNSPPAGRRRAIRRAAAGALGLDAVERERGTSVSSAVLSFEHEGLAFNLLDGPGHETVKLVEAAGGRATFVSVDVTSRVDNDLMARTAIDQYETASPRRSGWRRAAMAALIVVGTGAVAVVAHSGTGRAEAPRAPAVHQRASRRSEADTRSRSNQSYRGEFALLLRCVSGLAKY